MTQNIKENILKNIKWPDIVDFEEKKQEKPLKWRDLEKDHVYAIIDTRTFQARRGKAVIGLVAPDDKCIITQPFNVWIPKRLAVDLLGKTFPVFVIPLGLKPLQGHPDANYHAYRLL